MINPEHYLRGLTRLESSFPTYHSTESRKKATKLSKTAETSQKYLHEFFQSKTQNTLLILNREDWNRVNQGIPFGLICGIDNYVIYGDVEENNPVYEGMKPYYDNSPSEIRVKLESLLQDSAEPFLSACLFWWNSLLVHEFTHNYAREENVVFGLKWFEEFFADYMCYAYLRRVDEVGASVLEAFLDVLFAGGKELVTHTSLEDFERLFVGVGAANYCWYHGWFNEGVVELYNRFGEGFIEDVIESLRVTGESLSMRLNESCEGFNDWFTKWRRLTQ